MLYGINPSNAIKTTFAAQPGFIITSKMYLLDNIIAEANDNNNIGKEALSGAMRDALANNHIFKVATSDNINGEGLAENEWVVYLVSSSNGSDYHWYRQNPDGSWSHKPGNTPVTNREFLGVRCYSDGREELLYGDIIYDPTTISRVSYEYNYDENGTLIYTQEIMDYDNVVGAFVVGY